jgi:hypothetical protein
MFCLIHALRLFRWDFLGCSGLFSICLNNQCQPISVGVVVVEPLPWVRDPSAAAARHLLIWSFFGGGKGKNIVV